MDPSHQHTWNTRLVTWWCQRLPLVEAWSLVNGKSVPIHKLTWVYLLGGVALFLLGVQLVTGCLLMIYYCPTQAEAHASVTRIMTVVPYGWLVRSVHVGSANALVATVLLHLVSVLLTRAYRRPRELTWMSGVVLLLLTLVLGFSGYLLPWNQRSYFATLVGTQIPGCLPGVGPIAVQLLRGGPQVSSETITRFYAAHVMLVPLLLSVVLGVHLGLVQWHGMSLPLTLPKTGVRDHEPFFTEFLLTDLSVWLVLLALLMTWAVWVPADVGPRADPLQSAPLGIQPEWYFLSAYQLLKYVPERAGVLAMMTGAVLLLAVPWIDRKAARAERSPWCTVVYWIVLLTVCGLQLLAWAGPSAAQPHEPFVADSYQPAAEAVWLMVFWAIVGFLVYYLQQLRRHNRRLRLLRTDAVTPHRMTKPSQRAPHK